MMRDTEYFNDKLFFFGNKEVKEKIKKLCKTKKVKMYILIDEALRDYLVKNNIEADKKPKVPQLI